MRRRRAGREAGFTLIEMIVALAVFSIAALALLRLQAMAARTTGVLDARLVAEAVARNVAVEAVTAAKAPAVGDVSGVEGNAGRAWRWVRHVAPLGDGGFLRIDVAVFDPAGTNQGHLSMVRRAGDMP